MWGLATHARVYRAAQPDSTRAYVSDVAESVHFVKYSTSDNRMTVFADDVTPRYMTAFDVVDADTVAGGDKFGNVFVLRLPEDVADDVFAPSGGQMLWDQGKLNGAENKVGGCPAPGSPALPAHHPTPPRPVCAHRWTPRRTSTWGKW